MSKITDDRHEHADRQIAAPVEELLPTPRLRRIPAVVEQSGLDTITRAVVLKLATQCIAGKITPEQFGSTLTAIAREWVQGEMERLSAKAQAMQS